MILALAALLLAADNPADAERAAWRYRRAVTIAGSESLASLVLPPELSAKAGPLSRDLRLVDETGREVPYLLDWTSEREGLATWRVDVKDVRREKEEAREAAAIRRQWTLDLGEPFDETVGRGAPEKRLADQAAKGGDAVGVENPVEER